MKLSIFALIPAMASASAIKDNPQDVPQGPADPLAMCPDQLTAVMGCYGGDTSKFATCIDCAFALIRQETHGNKIALCDEIRMMSGERYGSCVREEKCKATCDDAIAELSQCMLSNVACEDEHPGQVKSYAMKKNLRLPTVATSDSDLKESPIDYLHPFSSDTVFDSTHSGQGTECTAPNMNWIGDGWSY